MWILSLVGRLNVCSAQLCTFSTVLLLWPNSPILLLMTSIDSSILLLLIPSFAVSPTFFAVFALLIPFTFLSFSLQKLPRRPVRTGPLPLPLHLHITTTQSLPPHLPVGVGAIRHHRGTSTPTARPILAPPGNPLHKAAGTAQAPVNTSPTMRCTGSSPGDPGALAAPGVPGHLGRRTHWTMSSQPVNRRISMTSLRWGTLSPFTTTTRPPCLRIWTLMTRSWASERATFWGLVERISDSYDCN